METEEPNKKGGLPAGWWIAIVVALIGLAGVFGAPIISAHFGSNTDGTTPRSTQISSTFVGRVSDDHNDPIAAAAVLATVDGTVGQTYRTDSNGQFQMDLPIAAKALILVVSATGFETETIQANVHRTGSEPIFLHAAPRVSSLPLSSTGASGKHLSKINPPPQAHSPAVIPQSTITASDCGAVNIGSNNINNLNCGSAPFVFSEAQEQSAVKFLRGSEFSANVPVSITYEWSAPDGQAAATQLEFLLGSIGIGAELNSCGMCFEYPGAPVYPGLSFGNVRPSNKQLADKIEAALKAAGVIKSAVKRDETAISGEQLYIYIRKP